MIMYLVSFVNSLDLNLDHFLKDMFYFLEIFTDSNFKFVYVFIVSESIYIK